MDSRTLNDIDSLRDPPPLLLPRNLVFLEEGLKVNLLK